MSDWYYSAGNNQRQGPLSSDDLVAQFRYGRIGLDTLVWRENQAQWQPLRDFATMLHTELLMIDENTTVHDFADRVRWNQAYYRQYAR
jgi:hypothetical protein